MAAGSSAAAWQSRCEQADGHVDLSTPQTASDLLRTWLGLRRGGWQGRTHSCVCAGGSATRWLCVCVSGGVGVPLRANRGADSGGPRLPSAVWGRASVAALCRQIGALCRGRGRKRAGEAVGWGRGADGGIRTLSALGKPVDLAWKRLFWATPPPNCRFCLLSISSKTNFSRSKTTGCVRHLGRRINC